MAAQVFAGEGQSSDASKVPRILLVNNSGSSEAFAYITANFMQGEIPCGQGFLDPETGRLVPIPAPSLDGNDLSTFLESLRIPFGEPIALLDRLDSGRVWFSLDGPLPFRANRNPEKSAGLLVQPTPGTPGDPAYEMQWDYCEFTYDRRGVTANISMVDAVGLPISLKLEPKVGTAQNIVGIGPGGTARLAHALEKVGGDWAACPVYDRKNRPVRVTSPAKMEGLGTKVFQGHYAQYVDEVWNRYREGREPLRVALGDVWPGKVARGSTTGNQIVFEGITDGSAASFPRPGTYVDLAVGGAAGQRTAEADIFGCDGSLHAINATQQGRVAAVLGAAFVRSTLLQKGTQPDTPVSTFYRNRPVHQYARLVHEISHDGRGYAFAFDDVSPAGARDQSGTVFHYERPDEWLLTITLNAPGESGSSAKMSAAPSELKLLSRTASSARLGWKPVTGPVLGYEVQVDGRVTTRTNKATATLTGLRPDRSYAVTVRARLKHGQASSLSAPVTVSATANHLPTQAGIISAASFTGHSGVRTAACDDTSPGSTGKLVTGVSAGDWLQFANVDLGAQPSRLVRCRLASGVDNTLSGGIEFRLGSRNGTKIAEIDLSNTGGWQSFTTLAMNLSRPVSGKQDLYLTFIGSRSNFVNINWIRFDAH
ncbi:beta-1,3-glucanase family protein [Streptomyces chartreusis]|uniref:beta-1,3-glucanase family protein n=1 Tax=Streptomyces chartreusis TaxID=1969 RepID=UPI0033DC8949